MSRNAVFSKRFIKLFSRKYTMRNEKLRNTQTIEYTPVKLSSGPHVNEYSRADSFRLSSLMYSLKISDDSGNNKTTLSIAGIIRIAEINQGALLDNRFVKKSIVISHKGARKFKQIKLTLMLESNTS